VSVNDNVVVSPIGVAPPSRYTRYVIGVDGSVDAVHDSWIELVDGLVPVGRPGTVGAVVSAGGAVASPGIVSTTKWS
jgi:hypothetical protein